MRARTVSVPGQCRAPRAAAGMTLVEMIVAIVLTGVLFAMGGALVGRSFDGYVVARDVTDVGWQGRVALERIERELRAIRNQTMASLLILQADRIRFIDTDGSTVEFSYDATNRQVLRGDGASSQPLADHVTALGFEYLDRNGVVLAPPVPENVYAITVTVAVAHNQLNQTYRVTLTPRHFQ
jgi:prepilin-type N-terminal cleavage/methylation domain-containing protein